MKLKSTKSQVKEFVELEGLLDGVITHEIKESSAGLKYIGPKIQREKWQEVLAFFIWVNDTTKSEAQVRIFFDPVDKQYLFWAFPQKASTGLSAHEIAGDDATNQRAALPHADKLVAIGTVHSHCDIGAFQSGTDEQDEKMVTGIHITVGHLSQNALDFHARFYVKQGCCFEPDMSKFWDIGAIKGELPEDMHDRIARFQMCHRPAKDFAFPQEWRDNLIEVKREPAKSSGPVGHHMGMIDDGYSSYMGGYRKSSYSAQWDLDRAVRDLRDKMKDYRLNDDDIVGLLESMTAEPAIADVVNICSDNSVSVEELQEHLLEEMLKKETSGESHPDWTGLSTK